ncbi:MAG: M20 family metallopeptidase [Patescibacteria group bacterium]
MKILVIVLGLFFTINHSFAEEIMTPKLLQAAQNMQSYVANIREYLHQHPGIRFSKEETAALEFIQAEVKAKINSSPYRVTIRMMSGGLVVDVEADPKFNWILFRADIDALGVAEETGLPYSSQTLGVSHACGHDANSAMLLGALRRIIEGKLPIKHNIRFVFQRAEENPITESGGAMLVREGVLDGVSAVYATHIFTENQAPSGQWQTRRGPFMSNSGRVKIEITCEGGHVATPNEGSNATEIMADIIVGMRSFAITHLGPLEPTSIVPATASAGEPNASNVRPGSAVLWFSFRHLLSPEKAGKIKAEMKTRIEAIVSAYPDAEVKITFYDGHPALRNDPAETQKVIDLLAAAGEKDVVEIDPLFGGEDFAHYLNKVPGTMVFLGAWQKGSGTHHQKNFNPDPSVFWKGVFYWLLLATN